MDVIQRIRQQLSENTIVLFIRGTAQRPMCEGSERVVNALNSCGAQYLAVNVQADPEIRAFVPKFSNWSKFPQLFLQGEFIGGSDIVSELAEQGELAAMIEACQPVPAKAS